MSGRAKQTARRSGGPGRKLPAPRPFPWSSSNARQQEQNHANAGDDPDNAPTEAATQSRPRSTARRFAGPLRKNLASTRPFPWSGSNASGNEDHGDGGTGNRTDTGNDAVKNYGEINANWEEEFANVNALRAGPRTKQTARRSSGPSRTLPTTRAVPSPEPAPIINPQRPRTQQTARRSSGFSRTLPTTRPIPSPESAFTVNPQRPRTKQTARCSIDLSRTLSSTRPLSSAEPTLSPATQRPRTKQTARRSGVFARTLPTNRPAPSTVPGLDPWDSFDYENTDDSAETVSDVGDDEDEWFADAMEDHREYLEGLKKTKPKKGKAAAKKNTIFDGYIGAYVIRCKALTDWEMHNTPTIDIESGGPSPGIRTAAVDFGIIEGTMLLAGSESTLDAFLQGPRGPGPRGGYIYSEDDDESDDGDDEEGSEESSGYGCGVASNGKRKATPTSKKASVPNKKSKKEASEPQHGLRLYFRIRGRETGEGEIFYTPEKGYLTFTDNTYTAFKGKCTTGLPALGPFEFEGFKVDDTTRNKAEAWNNFSEREYERARVGRWG